MLKFEAHYWLILSELDVYQVPDKLHSVHQCAREEAFNSRVEDVAKPTVTFTALPQQTNYRLSLLQQVLQRSFVIL